MTEESQIVVTGCGHFGRLTLVFILSKEGSSQYVRAHATRVNAENRPVGITGNEYAFLGMLMNFLVALPHTASMAERLAFILSYSTIAFTQCVDATGKVTELVVAGSDWLHPDSIHLPYTAAGYRFRLVESTDLLKHPGPIYGSLEFLIFEAWIQAVARHANGDQMERIKILRSLGDWSQPILIGYYPDESQNFLTVFRIELY